MFKNTLIIISIFLFTFVTSFAQNIQVETIADLDASGGVTFGPDGNIYISDFGPALGTASSNTTVYKMEYGTWEISEFATGFTGASGSRFDSQGNFYQSNPSGGQVSKRSPDGNVNYNWVTTGISGPIGITNDAEENLYVCNCGTNTIRKITPSGSSTLFASSSLFNCPNGITIDTDENLYVCNFNDGRILKVNPAGEVSVFVILPTFGGVGNGHITYSNGFLFVATIGVGQIYKLSLSGESELIAGVLQGFSNNDGPGLQATFSKPNGIAASITGDTLWVNCSIPTWPSNNLALHPGVVRMITGVCSLDDVECPLLTTSAEEIINTSENLYAAIFPPVPNPAQSETIITYEIYNQSQEIKLSILDSSQKLITTLLKGRKQIGIHREIINLTDLSSGIYYIVLETQDYILSQKIILIE